MASESSAPSVQGSAGRRRRVVGDDGDHLILSASNSNLRRSQPPQMVAKLHYRPPSKYPKHFESHRLDGERALTSLPEGVFRAPPVTAATP